MISWAKSLERALKLHDSLLFVQESRLGRYDIYRKSQFGDQPSHFLFPLTENWTVNSRPVEYGIEVVLNRIKAHDLWRDDSFVERWIAEHSKLEESKERARQNSMESFFYDFAGQFQKATDGVNTGTLNKLYRKENQNGYYQPRS